MDDAVVIQYKQSFTGQIKVRTVPYKEIILGYTWDLIKTGNEH